MLLIIMFTLVVINSDVVGIKIFDFVQFGEDSGVKDDINWVFVWLSSFFEMGHQTRGLDGLVSGIDHPECLWAQLLAS